MVAKINDPSFVNRILTNQTAQLLAQFKAMFADQTAVVDALQFWMLDTSSEYRAPRSCDPQPRACRRR
jgi:hypothetical protein